METLKLLSDFFEAIEKDPRINTTHIGIYASLIQYWQMNGGANPIRVFSHQIKHLAKVSGNGTYHRCIQDLHYYGYIRYEPSYNKNLGSKVYLVLN